MTVRRLAEKQPPSFAFTPENLEWAKARSRNIRRAGSSRP